MKRFWLLAPLLLAACSDGADIRYNAHPPVISNLAFSTALSVSLGYGGGTATLTGSFDFSDAGRDVDRGLFEVLDRDGRVIGVTAFDIPGVLGAASGTVEVQGVVSTNAAGSYPFQVRAKDAMGSVSNPLRSSFEVNGGTQPGGETPVLQVRDLVVTRR